MSAISLKEEIVFPSLDRPGQPKMLHHFIGLNTKACLLLERPRFFQNFDTYTLLTTQEIKLVNRLPEVTVFSYDAPAYWDQKNRGLSFLLDEVRLRHPLPDYILEHIMDLRGELLFFEARWPSFAAHSMDVFCARVVR